MPDDAHILTLPNNSRARHLDSALRSTEGILDKQRRTLKQIGCALPPGPSAAVVEAVVHGDAPSDDKLLAMLHLSLSEIAARQDALDGALGRGSTGSLNAVALDALVSAMHRIRTAIDVALGCSEEAAEISQDSHVIAAARESAAALRLIYHFTNELSDLASLDTLVTGDAAEDFDCNAVVSEVVADLVSVARDTGRTLVGVPHSAPIAVHAKRRLVRRALSYLIVNALASPVVHSVRCSVHAALDRVRGDVVFRIEDDGNGAELADRAATSSYAAFLGAQIEGSADASGFGAARRLAAALGGRIDLETSAGAGSALSLYLPRS